MFRIEIKLNNSSDNYLNLTTERHDNLQDAALDAVKKMINLLRLGNHKCNDEKVKEMTSMLNDLIEVVPDDTKNEIEKALKELNQIQNETRHQSYYRCPYCGKDSPHAMFEICPGVELYG